LRQILRYAASEHVAAPEDRAARERTALALHAAVCGVFRQTDVRRGRGWQCALARVERDEPLRATRSLVGQRGDRRRRRRLAPDGAELDAERARALRRRRIRVGLRRATRLERSIAVLDRLRARRRR